MSQAETQYQPAYRDDDHLSVARDRDCSHMLRHYGDNEPDEEAVEFSALVVKINRKGKRQDRSLVITNKAIYNLLPRNIRKCQRRIDIRKLGGISVSSLSNEFVVHVPEEWDYHFETQYKEAIKELLICLYHQLRREKLRVRYLSTENLNQFVATKDLNEDRRRQFFETNLVYIEETKSDPADMTADTSGIAPTELPPEYDFVNMLNRVDDLYEILFDEGRELGSGMTGRVLEVKDPEEGIRYAMKEMHRNHRQNSAMFIRESRILLRLMHDNIVALHDLYIDRQNYYICQELCTGGTLFERLRQSRVDEKLFRMILQQLLTGVKFMHDHNIVHRDIKPENVMFADGSPTSRVVLVDFGSAIQVTATKMHHDFVGSPAYMSPENFRIRTGDELKATDIWAIGITAYRMACNAKFPFWGKDLEDLYTNIVSQPLSFPNAVGRSFQKFIKSLLKRNVANRATATTALQSAWIVGRVEDQIDSDFLQSWGDKLGNYRDASILKKIVVNMAVHEMSTHARDKLNRVFERIDQDDSGTVDQEELIEYLNHRGIHGDAAERRASAIMKHNEWNITTTPKESQIHRDTFFNMHYSAKVANDKFLRRAFQRFDVNNDGMISSDELRLVLETMEEETEANETAVEEIIREVDKNRDGLISWEEFRDAMVGLAPRLS